MTEPIKVKYKGDGTEFLHGVPRRDLTEEDYAALTPEDRLRVHNAKQSGGKPLYDVHDEAPAAKADEKPPVKADKKDSDKKDGD